MKHKLALSLIVLLCTGCAIGPDYERPLAELPANWRSLPGAKPEMWKPASPADNLPKTDWWKSFNDPILNELEDKAIAQNQTLKGSLARLDQAIATSEARGAALYPTVALSASGSRVAYSANRATSTYDSLQYNTVQNNFQPSLVLAYEVDWLGKVRRDVEAARDTAEQAAADTANVKLLITAQLAAAYFLMRQNDEEIRVLENLLSLQKKLVEIYQKRYNEGSVNRSDLAQQEALVESNGAQIEILKGQRNIQLDLIATLTGTPAASLSIGPGRLPAKLPAFPTGVPSALLERRPDIASAERAMAAANAQIGVAEAAFYPSFLMTPTLLGYQSTNLASLFSLPSMIWSIGLTATQQLFDAGRVSANYRFAKAGYASTLANYRQTILVGIQETQDAMGTLQQLALAREKQDAAVTNLNKALNISLIRYKEGLDNALQLTLIQQNQLVAERIKWQIHGGQFIASVNLVKALGGGWEGLPKPLVPEQLTNDQTFGGPGGAN
jgi:NodT family efflux transporter outer membrane factor (OMF) lipoprotein